MCAFLFRHQRFILFKVGFFLLAGSALWASLALKDPSAFLVIHFDAFRGIDTLGTRVDVFTIIEVGFGIWLINLLLSALFRRRAAILSYWFAYVSILVTLLLFIAVRIILSTNS